jgi:iron(III) transport system permease protein
MPSTTRVTGLLLIVIGVASYTLTGRTSITALIPAFIGAVLVICALIARKESARKHAMHAAVAVALLGALLNARRRVRGGRLIELLLALPWAVPGTVFAIALATAFSVRSPLTGRVILVGTLWILPLAYLVRNLPITSRAILAGVRALDPSLDEAAASLGARGGRALRRITLPLQRPALLAGASLAFVTAFGDFVTSIMLYTYDTRPISLEILSSLRQSDVGVAAAYGVVLMLVSAAVFAVGADRGGSG